MNDPRINSEATAAIDAMALETMPIARERIHPHNPRLTRNRSRLPMNASDKRRCKRVNLVES
jgi:hypothetical protein